MRAILMILAVLLVSTSSMAVGDKHNQLEYKNGTIMKKIGRCELRHTDGDSSTRFSVCYEK